VSRNIRGGDPITASRFSGNYLCLSNFMQKSTRLTPASWGIQIRTSIKMGGSNINY
jgi:hypothetical protein